MALRINMCELAEGKSTGFPVIRDALAANGNQEPIFYTDDQQLLFMVTLPCHDEMKVTKSVTKSVSKSKATFGLKIWQLIQFTSTPKKLNEIFKHIRITNQSKNKSRFIDPLIEIGWLEMTIPDKPNSRLQQYKLTEECKKLLE